MKAPRPGFDFDRVLGLCSACFSLSSISVFLTNAKHKPSLGNDPEGLMCMEHFR